MTTLPTLDLPRRSRAAASTSTDFCLTAARVETVHKLYDGVRDPQGRLLHPGYELRGSELNRAGWIVPTSGDEEYTATDAASYTPEVSKAEEDLNIQWLGAFRSG